MPKMCFIVMYSINTFVLFLSFLIMKYVHVNVKRTTRPRYLVYENMNSKTYIDGSKRNMLFINPRVK